jgi:hypothetical protein
VCKSQPVQATTLAAVAAAVEQDPNLLDISTVYAVPFGDVMLSLAIRVLSPFHRIIMFTPLSRVKYRVIIYSMKIG